MRKKHIISISIVLFLTIAGIVGVKAKKYLVSLLSGIDSNTKAIVQISNDLSKMNNKVVENPPIYDELSNRNINLKINGETVDLDLTKNNSVIFAKQLTTEFPNKINVDADNDIEVFFEGENLDDLNEFEIEEIQKNVYKSINIKCGKLERNYRLELLPSSFPSVSMASNELIDGDIYSNFTVDNGDSYIYKMDNIGKIKFYKSGHYNQKGSLMNFNKHISSNGEIRYSYFEPEVSANSLPKEGIGFGYIILMDERYNVINKIELKTTKQNIDPLVENHEFIYIDDNHYIVSGAVDKTIIYNGESTVLKAAYFQEVKDNQVIFEWLSTSDESLLKECVEKNKYMNKGNKDVADYVHINSIDIDPKDGNFICSFRNQNSVVKISRETGKIIWKLSGKGDSFNLTDEQKFSRQHYAKYQEDGSILLFDNGNDNQQTRVLRFKLDEENKTVLDFREYKINSKFSMACGSVQSYDLENEIFTIGWGMSSKDKVIMSVVDFKSNKILAEIHTDKPISTYRSLIFK